MSRNPDFPDSQTPRLPAHQVGCSKCPCWLATKISGVGTNCPCEDCQRASAFRLSDRVSQPPDPLAASDQATFAVRDTRLLRTNGKSSTFPCCRKPICTPSSSSGRLVPHFMADHTAPSACHIRYTAVESTALARDTKKGD